MRNWLLLLIILLVVGCGGEKLIKPTTGVWKYSEASENIITLGRIELGYTENGDNVYRFNLVIINNLSSKKTAVEVLGTWKLIPEKNVFYLSEKIMNLNNQGWRKVSNSAILNITTDESLIMYHPIGEFDFISDSLEFGYEVKPDKKVVLKPSVKESEKI